MFAAEFTYRFLSYLFYDIKDDELVKSPIIVIPAKRLCRNSRKRHKYRHTGESRHPEVTEITGFRVALRLHGMTKK